MRKLLPALLAAAMLLSLLSPALALEDGEIFTGEDGQPLPMYLWSTEQWQQAADWGDQQAYAYFVWEDSLYYVDYEAWSLYYDMTIDLMYSDAWTDEVDDIYSKLYEAYYTYSAELRRQESIRRMKMPYEDGINIVVNGQYMVFDSVRAVVEDGVTMIPAKALAQVLGAEYAETGSVAVITRDGVTVSADGQGRTLTINGKTAETVLGPYVQDGETMVPLRAAVTAFGCMVRWDSTYNLIFVVDRFALVNKINESFTIANQLLAALTAYSAEDGKTEVSVKAEVVAYGDETNYSAALGITGQQILSDGTFRGDYDIELDLELIKLLLPYYYSSYYYYMDETEEMMATIEQVEKLLDGSKLSLIFDEEGNLYIKTSVLDQYLPLLKGKWLLIPQLLEQLVGSTGDVDMSVLTVGDLIYQEVWMSYYYYSDYSYLYGYDYEFLSGILDLPAEYFDLLATTAANPFSGGQLQIDSYIAVFGDQAFTKTADGSYSLHLDYDEAGVSSVKADFSFKLVNGELDSLSADANIQFASLPANITLEFNMDSKGSYMLFELSGLILGKIIMEAETTFTPGTFEITMPAEKDVVDVYSIY